MIPIFPAIVAMGSYVLRRTATVFACGNRSRNRQTNRHRHACHYLDFMGLALPLCATGNPTRLTFAGAFLGMHFYLVLYIG